MASVGFAFTSGQAEAMCKASPPSVVAPARSLAPLEAVCRPGRPKDRLQHPRLNFDDLPEALLTARVLKPWRPGPGRLRVKALSPPSCEQDPAAEEQERQAVAEENPEGIEADGYLRARAEAEDQQWSCPACTFPNCGLLRACEMCQTERNAQPRKELPTSLHLVPFEAEDWPPLQATPGGKWPALEAAAADSWVDCEVSSVGSSWLDIDGAEACLEDDDAILVSAAAAPPAGAPLAACWAPRAGAAAGEGAAAKPPRQRLPVQPLAGHAPATRRPRRERQAKGEDEDEEDLDLLDLEDRRLHPRTMRGAMHRLRIQRHHK